MTNPTFREFFDEVCDDLVVPAVFPVRRAARRTFAVAGIVEGCTDPSAAGRFNPMNSVQKVPGSTDFNWNNGTPVQNYRTFQRGVFGTVTLLRNPRWAAFVHQLRTAHNRTPMVEALADVYRGFGADGAAQQLLDISAQCAAKDDARIVALLDEDMP